MAYTAPRKTITLPESKIELVIRKLGPADYLGGAPDNLMEAASKKIRGREDVDDLEAIKNMDPKALEFVYAQALAAIVRHPQEGRIVYKRPEDLVEGEFSFYDLPQVDQLTLVRNVYAFTGEGTASAQSFPEAQS